jgi:hypothetical protein
MLAHIFYSFGILFVIRTISSIYGFQKYYSIMEWKEIYCEKIGRQPKDSEYRSKEELDIYQTQIVLSIFELTWLLIGLFTLDMNIFISIISMFFLVVIFRKSFRFTVFEKTLSILFILLRFFVYLLLIVNDFTNRYDLWSIIKNWIW